MKSRREILQTHYIQLAKKFIAWMGVFALMVAALGVTAPAQALQLTDRSLTLGSSAASASTTYLFSFEPGTTGNVGAIKFEICTSPLENVSCTAPTGTNASGAAGFTAGGAIAASGFALGAGTPPAPTTDTIWITDSSPGSLSAGVAATASFTTIVNPSTANQSFYARITTYTNANGSGQVDYGAVAVSTANTMQVNANVQESLTFCVYTGINCAAGGSSVNIGSGTDNVLGTTDPSGGVSKMDASTNATTGYVITYITSSPGGTGGSTCPGSLSSSTDCISDAGGSAVGPPADGVGLFGINLKANTTALTPAGAIGVEASGGTGAAVSPYATADQIAFQGGTTPRTVANTAGAPSVTTTYTVSYVAQAGNTTKPGAYSATFTWVATGTF
jgi:hypothetical protein